MPPVGARLRALAAAVSLSEVSGALGDMGTLLPILVSLGRTGQVSVTASLVFGGLFNIATGLLYDIPMCVQPMKAIAATALASNLSRAQIVSAGMCVSAVALLLGVTGLIKVVNAYIPMTIVRGIQLGAGLTLIVKGCQSVLKANLYSFAGFDYMDNFLVAALAFLLVLVCYRARSINPAALTLFATGVVLAVVRMYVHNDPKPSISIGFPAPTAPSAADFLSGFLSAGLGQLPLTLLNSVIAVAKLADDLFPDRPSPVASVTSIATFVGLLNLVGGWFGSTPYCHGAGGLAAQYRFGARSGASVVLLGLVKIVVGLLFGSTLVYVFQLIPNTIIGVMLAVAGIELAACARDLASHSTPADYEDHFVVMIVTAGGLIGFSNDGIGFCLGCVAALVLRLARWHRSKGRRAAAIVISFKMNLTRNFPKLLQSGHPHHIKRHPLNMPLLSRLQAFSFNTESWFSTSTFVVAKNLLLLINFLSMLAGLILIGAGGYINTNSAEDIVGLSGSIAAAAIVIGCIVSIVSFLGCFGAANEKGMLLKTYFALLIILVILEISVGAAAYAKRDSLGGLLDHAWHDSAIYNNATVLRVENLLKCCGYANITDAAVPANCAVTLGYQTPCVDELMATLRGSLSTIGGGGLAIGVIELVGLIFSVVLFRKIAAKENAQSSLLNEAWRINRTKVQYGYQNYQYV